MHTLEIGHFTVTSISVSVFFVQPDPKPDFLPSRNAFIAKDDIANVEGVSVQPAPSLQTKLAAEAQAKYERELMLHAADVEALQELKKKAGLEGAQKRELEEEVSKTCSLLQEKSTAWSALEKHLKVGPPAPRRREQNLM